MPTTSSAGFGAAEAQPLEAAEYHEELAGERGVALDPRAGAGGGRPFDERAEIGECKGDDGVLAPAAPRRIDSPSRPARIWKTCSSRRTPSSASPEPPVA